MLLILTLITCDDIFANLSLAKMLSDLNACGFSDIQEDELETTLTKWGKGLKCRPLPQCGFSRSITSPLLLLCINNST